jgi:hypothetical protein
MLLRFIGDYHKTAFTKLHCFAVSVRWSNSGGGENFCTRSDRPWGPPSPLYNGCRIFPGGKTAGAWRWQPTPSSPEVKERVELYLKPPLGLRGLLLSEIYRYFYIYLCFCSSSEARQENCVTPGVCLSVCTYFPSMTDAIITGCDLFSWHLVWIGDLPHGLEVAGVGITIYKSCSAPCA